MTADWPALQLAFNIFQFLVTVALAWYVRRVAKQKTTELRFKNMEDAIAERAMKSEVTRLRTDIAAGCAQHQTDIAAGCARHQARTTQLESDAATLRVELDHLPSQAQFGELNKSILALNGELQNTQGRLEGINRAVDLINEFLINQGGKVG